MNKQQLATKIWGSANKLRSKIEANEYKDYILGFIFTSTCPTRKQITGEDGWEDDDMTELTEEDEQTVEYIHNQIGYFIAYNDLFSTWLEKGKDFSVD